MTPATAKPKRKSAPLRLPAGAKTRAPLVLQALREGYPNARTELEYRDAFELLVATVLSAQATDVSVNAATPALFDAYPDAFAMAEAEAEDIEPYIRRIGLYRAKAKNLAKLARQLVERHGGEVPNDFEAVIALAGAGRKTANVVLSNAFGRPAIAVDTHVGRLARRLGLANQDNPDKVEAQLERLFPRGNWVFLHHALILHGRRVCHSRKPNCPQCQMLSFCPQIGVDEALKVDTQKGNTRSLPST